MSLILICSTVVTGIYKMNSDLTTIHKGQVKKLLLLHLDKWPHIAFTVLWAGVGGWGDNQQKWDSLLSITVFMPRNRHVFHFNYAPSNTSACLLSLWILSSGKWAALLPAYSGCWLLVASHEIWLINFCTNWCYLTSSEPSLLLGNLINV